jgi:hypothetical protein
MQRRLIARLVVRFQCQINRRVGDRPKELRIWILKYVVRRIRGGETLDPLSVNVIGAIFLARPDTSQLRFESQVSEY